MALWRATATTDDNEGPSAALARALCAAELDEDRAASGLPIDALRELFQSATALRDSVPYAAVRLLAQLASDGRVEVRTRVAETLGAFVDLYPERVEPLLLRLASDVSRKVRWAATASLGALQTRRPLTRSQGV
jgi:HEAT repeat protein